MDIGSLWFTQRKLKRVAQLPKLVQIVKDGGYFDTLIELQECDDNEVEIVNGHHRIAALWLAGLTVLRPEDYCTFLTETTKGRFWRVQNLRLENIRCSQLT